MAFALRCPECRQAFKWDATKKFPRYCLLCNADLGEERADDDIVMPAFLTARNSSIDKVGEAMMASSLVRAETAAAMLGVPASEMSDMKVTNLNPTKHEGAIAMPQVVNEVTQRMDAMAAKGLPVGFGAGPTGAELSAGVAAGAYPNSGLRTMLKVRETNGNISDRPGNETLAPGYVRRA